MEHFLDETGPSFLCVSEHWFNSSEADSYHVNGFTKVSSFCRRESLHGGTAIYAREEIAADCKGLDVYNGLSCEFVFECSAVLFRDRTCILSLYRSQRGDFDIFVELLAGILADNMSKKRDVVICGDFNVDNLRDSNQRRYLRDLISSYELVSLVQTPTRISRNVNGCLTESGLDYVIVNFPNKVISCHNFDPAISDHHVQALTWAIDVEDSNENVNYQKIVTTRQVSGINLAEFRKLFYMDDFFCNPAGADSVSLDINALFNTFFEHFTWCFNASCPLIKRKIVYKQKDNFKLSRPLRDELSDLRGLTDCVSSSMSPGSIPTTTIRRNMLAN